MLLGAARSYALSGSDWEAGNIINDSVFTDTDGMSVDQIQSFINGQINAGGGCDTWGTQKATEYGSNLTHAQYAASKGWAGPPYVCLNEYYEVPKTSPANGTPDNSYNHYDASSRTLLPVPGGVSAAQIIYDAAQQYQISPKVLLVKLQTESAGPVTQDTWPLQSQYTYALGSHCPDSGPGGSAQCDTTYAGFSIQVYSAASLLRYYLDNMQQPWWPYKIPYTTNNVLWNTTASNCGGGNVYIGSMATAALYTYTPYQPNAAALANVSDSSSGGLGDGCSAYGNRNFWWWFSHWFGNPSYPPSPAYIPSGTYNLVGQGSSKAIDVSGGSSVDGTPVQIYGGNGTSAQQWTFSRDSQGYYTIQNAGSGKYLDAYGAGIAPGTKLDIWTGNNTCAQKWAAQAAGSGFVFLNACSGLALDVPGGSSVGGTQLQIYTRNGTSAQTWNLTAVNQQPVIQNGFYSLLTTASTALDIPGGSTTSGTQLQIYNQDGTGSQQWQITRQNSGFYELRNVQSGKYLDVIGASAIAGTHTQIWDGNHTCSQEWAIVANSDGSYGLVSSCSGLKLDVYGNTASTNGTPVDVWNSNGTTAQEWTLSKLTSGFIPDGAYSLLTPAGTALDIPGGNTKSGTVLQIYSKNGTGSQQWQLQHQSNGTYELFNPLSGKYLDAASAGAFAGAPVQIWGGNNTCSQQWTVTANSDGTYGFASTCSNMMLDVHGNTSTINGTPVDVWNSNSTTAQTWTLAPPNL